MKPSDLQCSLPGVPELFRLEDRPAVAGTVLFFGGLGVWRLGRVVSTCEFAAVVRVAGRVRLVGPRALGRHPRELKGGQAVLVLTEWSAVRKEGRVRKGRQFRGGLCNTPLLSHG